MEQQIASLMSCDVAGGEVFVVPKENDIVTKIFNTSYMVGSCTNIMLICTPASVRRKRPPLAAI